MATDILMPALTPTMEVGTLSQWLVKPGDTVSAGQVIAEIETDKSVLEFESLYDGTIGELLVEDGEEDITVDRVIATIVTEGDAPAQPASSKAAEPATEAAPRKVSDSKKVRSSPAARRIAKELGIDIATITGTGPRGRITAKDVQGADIELPGNASDNSEVADNAIETVALTTLQKTMAKRMAEAKATIPHLYCSVDINVDALFRLRRSVNDSDENTHTTVNDYVIRAVAMALQSCPEMNVQFDGNSVQRYADADVAVAMASESGLVTPILRGANKLSVIEISARVRELAEKAQQRKLLPEDYNGGTFTVSNVGSFGIDRSWPIINPPQVGILGVGAASARPAVIDGELKPATLMTVTLSADHRIVDGAIAGAFLAAIKEHMEKPAQLLL